MSSGEWNRLERGVVEGAQHETEPVDGVDDAAPKAEELHRTYADVNGVGPDALPDAVLGGEVVDDVWKAVARREAAHLFAAGAERSAPATAPLAIAGWRERK
ncbi:dynein heavy chain 7, axonemal-like protein [Babesia caballi]|uniref:Dynein heavy chain 7, axonemal-like protein n=1 Tax=Babesia caballi TaxID=5871 RepID=A0AAV4LN50_BABCB|nr:dynein heavy chain 7, axonemal-like protein [Babesia caballi]